MRKTFRICCMAGPSQVPTAETLSCILPMTRTCWLRFSMSFWLIHMTSIHKSLGSEAWCNCCKVDLRFGQTGRLQMSTEMPPPPRGWSSPQQHDNASYGDIVSIELESVQETSAIDNSVSGINLMCRNVQLMRASRLNVGRRLRRWISRSLSGLKRYYS